MACSGKEKGKEIIFGNVKKSYDYVESLKYELLKRNPDSHVDVKLEPVMHSKECLYASKY